MQPTYIPKHADEPIHFLLWSLDEISPMLIGLLVGFVVGQVTACVLLGLLMTRFYKRFRDNHPDGYFVHLLYWWGIPLTGNKHFPNPMIKTFKPL